MNEQELADHFGDAYQPPVEREQYDDAWERTIELKISNQGKMILGLAAGTAVVGVITLMQGRIVLNVAKSHGQLIEIVNGLAAMLSGGDTPTGNSQVRYSSPAKPTENLAVDDELLQELADKMPDARREPEL